MDDIIVIGRPVIDNVIGVIRDASGEVEVNLQFAFDNPDTYEYLGCGMEWNTKVHYFRYVE